MTADKICDFLECSPCVCQVRESGRSSRDSSLRRRASESDNMNNNSLPKSVMFISDESVGGDKQKTNWGEMKRLKDSLGHNFDHVSSRDARVIPD